MARKKIDNAATMIRFIGSSPTFRPNPNMPDDDGVFVIENNQATLFAARL